MSLVHDRLPTAKIIDHSVAFSAYHLHGRGMFLLYLSQLNLSGKRCDIHVVFSVKETAGIFTTHISLRGVCFKLHKNHYILLLKWTLLGQLCILAILIVLRNERDCWRMTCTSPQMPKNCLKFSGFSRLFRRHIILSTHVHVHCRCQIAHDETLNTGLFCWNRTIFS